MIMKKKKLIEKANIDKADELNDMYDTVRM